MTPRLLMILPLCLTMTGCVAAPLAIQAFSSGGAAHLCDMAKMPGQTASLCDKAKMAVAMPATGPSTSVR